MTDTSTDAPAAPAAPAAAEAIPPVAVGDVQLYDDYVPAVFGGDYQITVGHDAPAVLSQPATAAQRFTVSAPQFAVDPGEVVQSYPPDCSTGQFGDVLPFVVLSTPELPWEREVPTPGTPWLALLVLGDDEIIGGTGPTRITIATVGAYQGLTDALVPVVPRESDVAATSVCSYVELSAATFTAVVPRADETRWLAHVRVVNPGDKALQGFVQDGTFSVVVANRFPSTPAADQPATRNIAHLVSVEGWAPWMVDQPVFTRSGKVDGNPVLDKVALVSLASWTFQSVADPAEDFAGLALDLLANEYDPATGTHHPDDLWLRMRPPALDTKVPTNAEVVRRVMEGFVPLAYSTRTGEGTVAWYRGPLVPVCTEPVAKDGPFLSADAAMAYDPAHGVFDLSLSAAWQIGRLAALSDRSFGTALYELRRRLHLVTDRLADRLARDHFDTPADLAELAASGLLADQVLKVLDADLLHDIGQGHAPVPTPPPDPEPPDSDPKAALVNFLGETANQEAVLGLVADDLDPVAQWLARLLLLEMVPFEHLVPDPAMLPLVAPAAAGPAAPPVTGSVRFFYVDPNWTGALLDGATSIGLGSSLQTFFHQMTAPVVAAAAAEAAAVRRSTLQGADPGPGDGPPGLVAGMLLRSPLVTGWPNLAVRPLEADGTTLLKTLRLERMGSGVLLALFDGVPSEVLISEPQEGFRFGLDEEGRVELRNLTSTASKLGAPLGPLVVRPAAGQPAPFLRADGRVLHLAPGSTTGLVQGVVAALVAAGQTVVLGAGPGTPFGPAAFALQVLKTPEELSFVTGTV